MASREAGRRAYNFSEEVLSVDCSPGEELLSSPLGSRSHGSVPLQDYADLNSLPLTPEVGRA